MKSIEDKIAWVQTHIDALEELAKKEEVREQRLYLLDERRMFMEILEDLIAVRLWALTHGDKFEIFPSYLN